MSSRLSPRSPSSDPYLHTRRLTSRDRLLLSWLAEHYLLSTHQVTKALFPSGRSARLRLTLLHRIEAVDRFVDQAAANSTQYLYALGPLGLRLNRDAYHDPDNPTAKPPRSNRDRADRIVGSRKLRHLIGVNDFFTDLLAHARTNPQARLERWWSEQHATDAYGGAGVQPDGHGIWTVGDATVGFFLEHDNGTEPLGRVLAKLRAYERVTEFGPRYPVLFQVPSRGRERNLLDALADTSAAMPIATAVHDTNPAGPVWTLTSDPDRLRHLHELPNDHGPYGATNPNRFVHRDPAVICPGGDQGLPLNLRQARS